MVLKGHGTFNSYKIYFFWITYLIEYRKQVSKNNSQKLKKHTQSPKTDVSDFKTFLMKFC